MTMNEIRTFRIGNPLNIRWPILTNGEALPLTGRNFKLYLTDPMRQTRQIHDFSIEGNIILWTFKSNEQEQAGFYHLTLFENEGEAEQYATDYMRAFRLVPHSNEVPGDMNAEELPLSSSGIDVGMRGLSAYEIAALNGYQGTEEQWVRDFDTVLSSSTIIVEQAQDMAAAARMMHRDAERIAALVSQLGHAGMTPVVEQTEAEVEIQPNVKNVWTTPMPGLTISFADGEEGYDNEYRIIFQCPQDAATALALPEGIRWMGGEEPDPKPGHLYEISVSDGMGIFIDFNE